MKYLLLIILLSLSSCITCEFSTDESYQDNSEKKEIAEVEDKEVEEDFQIIHSLDDSVQITTHQLIINE